MLRIERVNEYPTMHYFGDPRHTQSMIAYMIFTEYFWNFLGSGGGAMGRAWVFQTRARVFNSRWIAVVSGAASNLKCSCATLVYKSVALYCT